MPQDHGENRSAPLGLSEVPLFRSLSAQEAARILERQGIWDAPIGTLVIEEGQMGDEFYVILQGQVEIVRALGSPEETHLGMRQPGEFIGEIGLLNQGKPRTATARVVAAARLLTVKYTDFSELLKVHPELAYEMASVLGARLTEASNENIRNLRNKNEKLQQAYDELKAAQAQIIEKEKLEHSLQLARKIQHSILPINIPQMAGYDIGALMRPAQAVGGDFFGVYPLDENHMALIVGDVSDKGVPAAIFMAQSHALLRASIQSGVSTTVALERVNSLLLEMNAQGLFVTIIYGILDTASGEFRYTRAGHELPIVLDAAGEVSSPPRGTGMVLGLHDDPVLEERSLVIPSGGFMLLYSDGIADDRNAERVRFGDAGLVELVKQLGIAAPAQQTCEAIYAALVAFQNSAPQFDDVTLLAVRRLG
jgi:serine phosphatase RsbU (regulator of sigma subunit)